MAVSLVHPSNWIDLPWSCFAAHLLSKALWSGPYTQPYVLRWLWFLLGSRESLVWGVSWLEWDEPCRLKFNRRRPANAQHHVASCCLILTSEFETYVHLMSVNFHSTSHHHGYCPACKKKENRTPTSSNCGRQWYVIGYCHVHTVRGRRKNSGPCPTRYSCSNKYGNRTRAGARAGSWSRISTIWYRHESRRVPTSSKEKSMVLHEGICCTGGGNIAGDPGMRGVARVCKMCWMWCVYCSLEMWRMCRTKVVVPSLYAALAFIKSIPPNRMLDRNPLS